MTLKIIAIILAVKVIKLKVRTTETKLLDHQSVLEALIQETT